MIKYTVSDVNRFIKQLFSYEEIFENIAVEGEISNFTHHNLGNMYFTLKDESSVIKCVLFKNDADRVRFSPKNGMSVIVRGRIGVFERDGIYQIYGVSIEQLGEGKQKETIEILATKLMKEGLFLPERKKSLPKTPTSIGVITAEGAAALKDITEIISRRYPIAKVLVYCATVQGENAAKSIVQAISKAQENSDIDVLIIGRGGGASEDLAAFNDENVVRAIANCKLPTICAVGHESDNTLSDLAADSRASTPSAAAEIAVPDKEDLKKEFDNLEKVLYNNVLRNIDNYYNNLLYIDKKIGTLSPYNKLSVLKQKFNLLSQQIKSEINSKISARYQQSLTNEKILNTLNPLSILNRGYALAFNENGDIIKSLDSINISDNISVRFSDGKIEAEITDKTLNESK